MEREYWKDAAFVTLTYRDDVLPPSPHLSDGPNLRPRHLQLFFKRLRKDLGDRKIKYFACGEYGDKGGYARAGLFKDRFVHRPHYHAIIYGLSPTLDRDFIHRNWPYADWQELESTPRGRKSIGTVTYDSCRYVAGYCQKKLFGDKAKELKDRGKVQPFSRMSQGLGLQFAIDNKKILEDALCVGLRGYTINIPHYFRDKLEIDPELIKNKHYELTEKDFQKFLKENPQVAEYPMEFVKRRRYSEFEFLNPLNVQARKRLELDLMAKERLFRGELEFDV